MVVLRDESGEWNQSARDFIWFSESRWFLWALSEQETY